MSTLPVNDKNRESVHNTLCKMSIRRGYPNNDVLKNRRIIAQNYKQMLMYFLLSLFYYVGRQILK